ncbi:MAG: T9SS type A sorting domain-containing protein [Bacteroidia bacterium]|nr:T9SS type A sorting domain-containing protein [Bacteroidia bacterium]MDW8159550.1 T9SS type A sorting domain-containing protein [Bacteroidia bacterium]
MKIFYKPECNISIKQRLLHGAHITIIFTWLLIFYYGQYNQAVAQCPPTANFIAIPNPTCTGNFGAPPPPGAILQYTGTGADPGAIFTWDCDNCAQAPLMGPGPHTVTWSSSGVKTIQLTVANIGSGGTFSSQHPPINIPDGGCGSNNSQHYVFSTIAVAGLPFTLCPADLQNMQVSINIVNTDGFPFSEDLDIYLITPSGNTLVLENNNMDAPPNSPPFTTNCSNYTVTFVATGGHNGNCTGTKQPKGATTASTCIPAAILNFGTFPPVNNFTNIPPPYNGTWRLFIADRLGLGQFQLVSWSITFPNPCCLVSTTFQQQITVNDPPATPTISASANVACLNDNITFNLTSAPDPNANYIWSATGPATISSPTSLSTNISWSGAGTHTVTLSAIVPGCPAVNTTQIVTVNNPPAAPIINPSATIACVNTPVTFSVVPNTPSTGVTHNWTFGGQSGALSTATTVGPNPDGPHTRTWTTAGNYTITLQASVPGCPTVSAVNSPLTVTIENFPSTAISPLGPFCPNVNYTISGPAAPGVTYTWNFGSGSILNPIQPQPVTGPGPFSVSWATTGAKTITLTASNSCGNINGLHEVQVINPPGHPTAPNVNICQGGVATITATMGTPAGNFMGLYLTPTGGSPITTDFNSPYEFTTPALSTTTTFYLESVIGSCASSPRTPVIVYVNTVPSIPVAENSSRCEAGSVTFTAYMGTFAGTEIHMYDASTGGNQVAVATAAPYILTTPSLTTNTVFYLEAVNSVTGCASNRLPVTAFIYSRPGMPTVQPISRCGAGKLTFTVTMGNPAGNVIRMYTDMNTNVPIATDGTAPYTLVTPTINTSTNFYISSFNSITRCESDRVEAAAEVISLPATPTAPSITLCSPGTTTISVNIGTPPSDIVRLYTEPVGGSPIAIDDSSPFEITTPFIVTNSTFYLEGGITASNCTSSFRAPIFIGVQPTLNPPLAQNQQRCGTGVVTFNVPFMDGNELRMYRTDADPAPIAKTSSLPYQLTTPVITTTTIFYLQTVNTSTGCGSILQPVEARVIPGPPPPVPGPDQERCGTGAATFSATLVLGDVLRLYESNNAPVFIDAAFAPPYIVNAPSVSTTTTFYISNFNSNTDCESERVPVVLTIHPFPAPPTADTAYRCGPGPVIFTISPADNITNEIRLYRTSASTSPLAIDNTEPFELLSPDITTVTSFYVEARNIQTGCNSQTRTPVIGVVRPTVLRPVVNNVSRCEAGPITFSVSIMPNTRAHLYLNENDIEPIATDDAPPYEFTQVVATTTQFYISAYNPITKCESPKVAATAIVHPNPAPPQDIVVFACGGNATTFTVLMNTPAGNQINLYDSPIGGNLIASDNSEPYVFTTPVLSFNTTYYVSAVSPFGCEGPRASVIVNIENLPLPPAANPVSRCGPGPVTITASPSFFEQNILLYNFAVGGQPIAQATTFPYELNIPSVELTSTFYLESQNKASGCRSAQRTPVVVTIQTNIPGAPLAANIVNCGPTSVILTASMGIPAGDQIRYYTTPSGGLPIGVSALPPSYGFPTAFLTTTTTFYAESFNSATGCSSLVRTPIVVTIIPLPPAPVVANAYRCAQGTLNFTAQLTSPDNKLIRMYSQATGGELLSVASVAPFILQTPSLATTTLFYFETYDVLSGCSSPRVSAEAVVSYITPAPPSAAVVTRCGPGVVTYTVELFAPFGDEVRLYTAEIGGQPLAIDNDPPFTLTTPFIVTQTTFYIESIIRQTGCRSLYRNSVVANVVQQPPAPTANDAQRCGSGTVSFTSFVQSPLNKFLRLYTMPVGGEKVAEVTAATLEITTPVITTTTIFYLSTYQLNAQCESARRPVRAIVNPLPGIPSAPDISICPFGQATLTAFMGSPAGDQILLYTVAQGGTPITSSNAEPYNLLVTNVVTSTVYYLESRNTITGCISPRNSVLITVHPKPEPPSAPNVQRCGPGVVTITATVGIGGDQVRLFDANGILITTSNATPYELETPFLSTSTLFQIETANTNTGCLSDRVGVLAVISPQLAKPTVVEVHRCGSGSGTFSVIMGNPAGNIARLYNAPSEGTLLDVSNIPPYPLTTPFTTSTTVYFVEVASTLNNCVSERVPVRLVINPLPSLPIVPTVRRCGGGSLTFTARMGAIPGTSIQMYYTPAGGSVLASDIQNPYELTTPFVNTTTTFYFEVFNANTGCQSGRVGATAVIHPIPGEPSVSQVQRCETGVVTFTATMGFPFGNEIRMYSDITGGNLISSDNSSPFELTTSPISTTTTFYIASVNNQTNCESPRVPAVAVVRKNPGTPQPIRTSRCGPGSVTITASMGVPEGNLMLLYTTVLGGNPINTTATFPYILETPSITTNTIFYLESQLAPLGCTSMRAPVFVDIYDLPQQPIISQNSRCGDGVITASVTIVGSGSQVNLYLTPQADDPFSVDEIFPYEIRTPFINTTSTFYLEVINKAQRCTSNRFPFVAKVIPLPGAPSAPDLNVCEAGTVGFTATMSSPPGTEIRLYSLNQGGSILSTDAVSPYVLAVNVSTTSTFFLEAFDINTGCASNRRPVTVTFTSKPATPFASVARRCGQGPVTITASMGFPAGNRIVLYDAPSEGAIVASSAAPPYELTIPNITTSGLYYIAAVNNRGCESARLPVVAEVFPVPGVPIASPITRCGVGTVLIAASMGNPPGEYIALYTLPSGGSAVATSAFAPYQMVSPTITTTTTFYLESLNISSGCRSARIPVIANVQQADVAMFVRNDGPKCLGEFLRLSVTPEPGVTYAWSGPNGFSDTGNQPIRKINSIADGGVYSVVAIVNGCTSNPAVTNVVVKPPLRVPSITYFNSNGQTRTLCEGETLTLVITNAASFPIGTIFEWTGPGFRRLSSSNTLIIEGVQTGNEGPFYAAAIYDGCTSAISIPADVTIRKNPPSPAASHNNSGCLTGGLVNLFASDVPNAIAYEWIGPGGFTAQGQSIFIPAIAENAGTYGVRAIDFNGCKSQYGTTEIIFNRLPNIPQGTLNANLCVGQTLKLIVPTSAGLTYRFTGPGGYDVWGPGPIFERNNMTLNHSGNYSLTAIQSGCTSFTQVYRVSVFEIPPTPTFSSNSPICEGQNLIVNITNYQPGVTYILSGPVNFRLETPTSQIIRNQLQLAHTGNYSLVAAFEGCTSFAANVPVQVLNAPPKPAATNNGPLCIGQMLTLSAAGTVPNATFTWLGPNNFAANGNIANRIITGVQDAGVYTVIAEIGNCKSEPAITNVVVNPIPSRPSVVNDGPKCVGSTITLSAFSQPGAEFEWIGPDGFTLRGPSTLTRELTSLNMGGNYSVTAIVGNCRSATAVSNVVVQPALNRPFATSSGSTCENGSFTLSAGGAPAGSIYLWYGPQGFMGVGNSITRTNVNLNESGIYSVIAVLNGCSSERATTQVVVNAAPPTPRVVANTINCIGEVLQLTAVSGINATFVWSGPNNFSATGIATSRVISSAVEMGTYSLVAVANGCSSSIATHNLVVGQSNGPIEMVVFQNGPVCIGDLLRLSASGPAAAEYTWQGPNGFSATGASVSRVISSALDAGQYVVTARLGTCSSGVASTSVEVIRTPVAPSIVGNRVLCAGQTLNLSASFIPGATYTWRGPNGFSYLGQQATLDRATVAASGTYSVTASVGTCASPVATIDVQVLPQPPTPIATNNTPICSGEIVQLFVTLIPGATYVWNGPSGYFSTIQNPIIPNATPDHSGVYTVYAVLDRCTSQVASTNVVVSQAPSLPKIDSNSPVCEGQTLRLSASQVVGATYTWYGPGGYIAATPNATRTGITTSQAGIYSLVVSSNGCTAQSALTLPVNVHPAPRAGFRGSSGSVCKGNSTTYEIILNGLGPWQLNYSINGIAQEPILVGNTASGSPFVFTSTVIPQETQIYELTAVLDRNGCVGVGRGTYTLNVENCNQTGCIPPANLRVEPTRVGIATVRWDVVSEESVCYVLSYGPSAQDPAFWQRILVPHPASSYALANLTPGVSYSVELRTNCNNCSFSAGNFSSPTNVSFVMPAAKIANQEPQNLKVYPNPTKGPLFIELEIPYETLISWKLTDLAGKILKGNKLKASSPQIVPLDFSELASGIYVLEVEINNTPYVAKIILE